MESAGTELVTHFRRVRAGGGPSRQHSLTPSECLGGHSRRQSGSLRSTPAEVGAAHPGRWDSRRTASSRTARDTRRVECAAINGNSTTHGGQFVYDADTIASSLGPGLQPVMDFLSQRLLTMSFWMCSNDFQQVRNALCIHLAEVSVKSLPGPWLLSCFRCEVMLQRQLTSSRRSARLLLLYGEVETVLQVARSPGQTDSEREIPRIFSLSK
jgi:hypothetical protein